MTAPLATEASPAAACAEPAPRGERRFLLLAGAAYLALALVHFRPLPELLSTHVIHDPFDPVFNLYLLKWVGHEVPRGFAGFWSPPFFYPERGVLAYSDHLLGPGLIATLWTAIGGGAAWLWIASYNILLVLSFPLTSLAACFVLRHSRLGRAAALLGGAIYGYSPFRWDQLSHLQVLLMALIPLTLWSFDRLLARPSAPHTALFLALYLVHLSGGTYLAYMIHIPLAVLFLNRLPGIRREQRWRALLPHLALTLTLAGAAAGLLFGTYWSIGHDAALRWPRATAFSYGGSIPSLFLPPPSTLAGTFLADWRPPEHVLFPGFIAIALVAIGCRDLLRAARGWQPWLVGTALVAGGLLVSDLEARSLLRLHNHWNLLAVVLAAAGGVLLLRAGNRALGHPQDDASIWRRGLLVGGAVTLALSFPAVFQGVGRVLPGLLAMRVPTRFQAFTSLAIALAAAIAFDRLWVKVAAAPKARRVALATGIGILLLLDTAPATIRWAELPSEDDEPAVESWFAEQTDVHAILELPLEYPEPAKSYLLNISYMYLATAHWLPLVNGYSAHLSTELGWLRRHCCAPAPDPPIMAALRRWGVSHILVHRRELPRSERQALDDWQRTSGVELVYAGAGDRVYRILPARTGAGS